MDETIKQPLWRQFGASIDMLANAVRMCPEDIWNDDSKIWYMAYHTIFFLDYYLTPNPESYSPPAPFTLSELDPAGKMPDRVYTKEEILTFLYYCKDKCKRLISGFNDKTANELWTNPYRSYIMYELQLYNMRHVQHHAAQINQLLRQKINDAPDWVSRTREE